MVSALEDLKRSRRVVPLRADDQLSVGEVYVLVPTGRAHCKVTDADMGIIEAACRSRKKKISGATANVLPEEQRGGSCSWVPIGELQALRSTLFLSLKFSSLTQDFCILN
ncbi:hypothetical protein V6N11_015940 [Hibiscus sabdariffa]|uniref:Uncharacterized protein n=1 Tax=Hibiscus sabdariffa TaxID=183260 RepID=A0ABR2TTN7_9ROSI